MNTETSNAKARAAAPVGEPGAIASGPSAHPNPVKPPNDSRCQHRFANGKRCRLPGLPSQSGLCLRHFKAKVAAGLPLTPSPSDFEDLSPELFPELAGPGSAMPLNKFLTRLLVLVIQGRITPRRAGVLCYLANQLLQTSSRSSPKSGASPRSPCSI